MTVENALGSSEARFSTYGLNNILKAFDLQSLPCVDENNKLWGVGANFYGTARY